MKKTIGATGMDGLCTWADVSYLVHEDICILTVREALMGVSTLHSKSSEELNKKFYTETKLVGVSKYLT